VVLFTFGGLLNAFAMTSLVQHLHHRLGVSEGVVLSVLFVAALGIVPVALLGGAAGFTRWLAGDRTGSLFSTAVRYAYALVPFGFGVWLAHYGFHFLTGALTIVAVTQSAVTDLVGWAALGAPRWQWTGMRPSAVLPIELGFVLLGTMGSIAVVVGISRRDYAAHTRAAAAPWAAAMVALASFAIWLLAQPMDMRGMDMGAARMAHVAPVMDNASPRPLP